MLNHKNVQPGKFGLLGKLPVDDQVYAQPLIAVNETVGSFKGNLLVVATVNNTVYAFDVDDPSKINPLWAINLNPAGKRSPEVGDLTDPAYGAPCGGSYADFSGRFGLVGTPVIDSASHTLYVSHRSVDSNGVFSAYIDALDIRTGKHKFGSPKRMKASVNGTGDGNVNGILKYDAKYQNQRPALLLYDSTIYIASASHCDWGPYHGWILGYDSRTLALKYTYNATPNGWAGGIWMAGQGISVGDDGNLYVVTGNGTTSPDNVDMSGGRSESLLKLTPSLEVLDWFTPANYQYLDELDLDYGCDGVMIVPTTT